MLLRIGNRTKIACPRTFTRFRRKQRQIAGVPRYQPVARREMLDGIPSISGAGGPTGPLPSSYSPRYLGNFPTPNATFVVN
jgi:hypothetical protein